MRRPRIKQAAPHRRSDAARRRGNSTFIYLFRPGHPSLRERGAASRLFAAAATMPSFSIFPSRRRPACATPCGGTDCRLVLPVAAGACALTIDLNSQGLGGWGWGGGSVKKNEGSSASKCAIGFVWRLGSGGRPARLSCSNWICLM